MRARVSMATLKRLEALEQARGQRKVVALFPELMPVDDWGELAYQMQTVLKDNIKKDTAPDYGDLPQLELVSSY